MKYNNSIIYSGNLRKGNAILVEKAGYNEIFSKEKMDNTDKWVIEITYFVNNEIHEEIIKIEKEELLKAQNELEQVKASYSSKLIEINKKHNDGIESIKEAIVK